MEEGFDISNIKWIIIFALFIIYKFFSAKPKVDPMEDEQREHEEYDKEGAEILESLEQLFGQREESPKQSEAEIVVDPKPRPRISHAAQSPRGGIVSSELKESPCEKVEESKEADATEEFDLQKAVIMSEILKRKYDE